jgi:hypothetical protein
MPDPASLIAPIPAWVCWLAQDSDGAWWGYSSEPLRHDSGWYENEVGRYVRLGHDDPSGWRDSLTRHAAKGGQAFHPWQLSSG